MALDYAVHGTEPKLPLLESPQWAHYMFVGQSTFSYEAQKFALVP